MAKKTDDIKLEAFIETMKFLAADLPVTKELDKRTKKVWHSCQKEHMLGWCMDQNSTGWGKYTRKEPNTSTRKMYNNFLNVNGLLWMAEAFGEEEETLRQAHAAALEAQEKSFRQGAAAFRKIISFDRLYELYCNPAGWHLEPYLMPYIGRGEDGYPVATSPKFMALLRAEYGEELDFD